MDNEHMRLRVVKAIVNKNMTVGEAAQSLFLSRSTVSSWVASLKNSPLLDSVIPITKDEFPLSDKAIEVLCKNPDLAIEAISVLLDDKD